MKYLLQIKKHKIKASSVSQYGMLDLMGDVAWFSAGLLHGALI